MQLVLLSLSYHFWKHQHLFLAKTKTNNVKVTMKKIPEKYVNNVQVGSSNIVVNAMHGKLHRPLPCFGVLSVIYCLPLYCLTADLGNGHPLWRRFLSNRPYIWFAKYVRNIQLHVWVVWYISALAWSNFPSVIYYILYFKEAFPGIASRAEGLLLQTLRLPVSNCCWLQQRLIFMIRVHSNLYMLC